MSYSVSLTGHKDGAESADVEAVKEAVSIAVASIAAAGFSVGGSFGIGEHSEDFNIAAAADLDAAAETPPTQAE